ncbi:uncharacterized protein LAESUDRAFT_646478 [Laetiporus sulphureus 93-53]|uniref:DUF4219 domain-containing protein n=1 Tax=Laetiporus sulphureus 93-53 TaxID=1314785 RepID=A0A165G410_9APHY|nr:uncharacterized protein LAESUDRAFT_646478 [Laetiporus sulphureus 93-53]KZT09798.1 hypothetical protein LAESUDRAFT_646478 [Laetiporus sulphureus 93-53]
MSKTTETTKFPLLGEDNYGEWAIWMEAELIRKELWEVMMIETSPPTDATEMEAAVWLEAEKAKRLMTKMAKAWVEMVLRRCFYKVVKGPDEVMSAWIERVKKMATDLESTGVKVEEEDMVLGLTMGLGEHYDQLIVTLDSIPPEQLTVANVTVRLLNEKTCQKNMEDDRDAVAMMAKAGKGKWKVAAGG